MVKLISFFLALFVFGVLLGFVLGGCTSRNDGINGLEISNGLRHVREQRQ